MCCEENNKNLKKMLRRWKECYYSGNDLSLSIERFNSAKSQTQKGSTVQEVRIVKRVPKTHKRLFGQVALLVLFVNRNYYVSAVCS